MDLQKKVSIVCFSWDPWDPMWKITQQLIWYLGKKQEIDKILYINQDLYMTTLIENIFKISLNSKARGLYLKSIIGKVDKPDKKILVYSPFHYLPFSNRYQKIKMFNHKLWETKLKDILSRHKFQNIILIINRVMDESVLDLFPDTIIRCFLWSDNWEVFPENTERVSDIPIKKRENIKDAVEKILSRSDIVFACSEYLEEKAKNIVKNSYWLPNATDYDNFSKVSLDETFVAPIMQTISRPIIGFVGFITYTIDFDLLIFSAKSKPNWSFVFIGPKLPAAEWGEELFKLKNVYHLGPKSYFELPEYIKAFDVCIIPYLNDPNLQGGNSAKVYDFLATGKPIVASYKIAGLENFDNIIKISGNKDKFVSDIEELFKKNDNHRSLEKKKIARENSWETRANYMWEKISELLY